MLRALKFALGAAAAIAIWWYATPAYNALLCTALRYAGIAATPVARAVAVTRVGGPSIQVPADQLTYNIILFAGLVAAMPPRIWRGLVALLAICVIHLLALYTTIESTYSKPQNFWTITEFIYRIGGMFAIAFVCWYAATFSGARELQRETSPGSARRAPARRKARAPRR